MVTTPRLWALWALVATTGCLSEPTGLDCAEAPPGTVGCPVDAGRDAVPRPDAATDAASDAGPDAVSDAVADGALPVDGAPPVFDAAVDAAPDAAPPPCEVESCPAPPVAGGCFGSTAIAIGEPACSPAACAEGEAGCHPAVAACRAFAGCIYWCALIENRDDCEAVCAERHLEPDGEAARRVEAVSACLQDAECPDGPDGAECQLDACPDEFAACLGEGGRLWFVRPPRPESAIVCDYPLVITERCDDEGLGCRQGACVDVDGPCEPDPCPPRAAVSCDGDTLVETASPQCVDDGGAVACEYAENRQDCAPAPPRCVGQTLQTELDARCVEDGEGARCQAQTSTTDCAAVLSPTCRGNTAVAFAPGACVVVGGAADCTGPTEQARRCDGGDLCYRGECTASTCAPQCEYRDVVGCTVDQQPIRVQCTREERCDDGDCAPIPEIHGAACRTAEQSQACARQGLVCRGLAAVPMCLLGDTPRTGRDTCWTTADCEQGTLCTRSGRCSSGAAGAPCEDADDCAGQLRCSRGQCR